MLERYSIAQAREHFTVLVRAVERQSAIELTRRGKPVAVILSVEEYQRLLEHQVGFWEAYAAFRERVNLQELGLEPATWSDLRDRSPGREVGW